jgi:hypothetical protein
MKSNKKAPRGNSTAKKPSIVAKASEGVMHVLSDQPWQPGQFRPIFKTPFSELADWLATKLNAHPSPTIDTDTDLPSGRE